jgi:PAS domain S-box-containing protein
VTTSETPSSTPDQDLIESIGRDAGDTAGGAEDLYQLIFNASFDGVAIVDRNGVVVEVNPALGKIDGYSRDEVIGALPPRFRAPEDRRALQGLLDRVLAGETIEEEVFLVHKNGSRRLAETRSARIIYRGEPHMLVVVRDLSERTEHEGELRRSEDRYRATFEASADGLIVVNKRGAVVDVNPAMSRLDGFSREEVLGQFPPAVRDPQWHKNYREYLDLVLSGGSGDSEGLGVRKDGSHYMAELRSVRIDYHGNPHVLIVVRDISERRERELELARSEDQYRTVFEGMIDGLVLLRADGVVVDANQAMLDLDGFSRAEVIGNLPPTYIGHPDRIAAHREYIRRVLNDEPVKSDFQFERKNGAFYSAEVRPILITYNNEPHVLLIIRDNSKQKAQNAALLQSEDRLRATVATALDSIIAMDDQGCIIDFNPAAEACFGYSRAEAIGRPLDEVIIPPHLRDAHRAGLNHYMGTGEGPFLGKRINVQGMRKDGSLMTMELAISVAHGGSGQIFIGYIRDITEQRVAAEQSLRLEAQLRQAQKMEAIGHLTGGIAHDFNNILTSILGYVTLARERIDAESDEKLDRYLDRAARAGGRARDLIAQMMTFSRGKKGEKEQVNVARLVRETLTLLESSLPASIEMHTDVPAKISTVWIDPVHFEQILVNLCINARDAVDGIGKLTVKVEEGYIESAICNGCRESVTGHFIQLSVVDNGPGMDEMVVERIFEPFFTTKDVGKGSGMGLSTVHGIVHDHDGHVLVVSEVGHGTTMRVLLHASEVVDSAEPDPAASIREAAGKELTGRILIVDDNVDVAEYLDDLLTSWGLEVTVSNDPVAAQARVLRDSQAYDLVITDQTMPGLSGLDLAKSIVALESHPVVFLYTGYSESVNEELALAAGVRAFLLKPLDTIRLGSLIREVLP